MEKTLGFKWNYFFGVIIFTVLYERTVNLFYTYRTIFLTLTGS